MAQRIDLTARRAARLEKAGDPPVLVVDGIEFPLPQELPLTFVEAFQQQHITEALGELLGSRAEEFMRVCKPSVEDLAEISKVYAVDQGEVSASTDS